MANPFSNRKKVRGWKRRLRQLERFRQAHLRLDVEALRAAERQYVKIWLDPWSRLVPRNPPWWFRRRILAALIDIHASWRQALEALGEPYYLELWLFHPDFHSTQVVAATGSCIDFYDNVFEPAARAAPRPPALYDHPAYDLGRFHWRPGTEINAVMDWPGVYDEEYVSQLARTADRVEVASTGDTLYIFELGGVWQGAAHPSTRPMTLDVTATDSTTPPASAPVWDDGAWASLPRLEGDVSAEVCVVGLGGSGLTCVGELLRRGASVVGIDAGEVAAGAAGRNGGFLLAGAYDFYHDAVERHGRGRARDIYRLTMGEIRRIADETPEAVRLTGSLRVADSPEEEADCRRQLAALHADALPAEWYEGPEGRGLLLPTDGAFNPLLRCRVLARRALDAGARLYEHAPALDVRPGEVVTPAGTVRCQRVIVAVDGRLERVFPELRGRVRTARLQMIATAPTDEVRVPRPVYARWGFEYWQQLPDGRIALGGFRDFGGEGEWTEETAPGETIQARLEHFLRERICVRAPITHRWAASVGFTPTGLPVLEEVRPGVWAAGGYSGTGNVIGALCGRAAAELALGGASSLAEVFASAPAIQA